MGKITGFLEFERHDRKYAPVEERIKHYREFVVPLPDKEVREQAARCMDCGVPFCHGTSRITGQPTGCPVNNQIPDWNDLVYRGEWDEAARNLHSTNNFPEVTGRICPAPCEASCTLNIEDTPVTIKTIECEIADRAIAQGLKPEVATHKTGKKVAVVGSGPAGMACAQQLARAGHDVHLYERWAKAGGLLRYGIPDFKMEKVHVDRRVAQMQAEGALGPDLTFVHCCFCGRDEIAMMADAGVTASLGVHCEMNAQGIGDIPFDRLLAAGIRPSLSGDTETKCAGDMFTQMRHAFAYYRSWMGGGHSRVPDAPATLLFWPPTSQTSTTSSLAAQTSRKKSVSSHTGLRLCHCTVVSCD